MRRKRPSPATVIAFLALVVVTSGTAIAASRYIITSTSQIKPSVLRELRGFTAHAATIFTGAHAVSDRVRANGSTTSATGAVASVALTGASWTQFTKEDQLLLGGELGGTTPPSAQCLETEEFGGIPGSLEVEIMLDRGLSDAAVLFKGGVAFASPAAGTWKLTFKLQQWLLAPAAEIARTITAQIADTCLKGGGHFTVNSLSIDVLGFK